MPSSTKPTTRIRVRRSSVHGNGVFASAPIAAGEAIVEYIGERITWAEAQRRHPHDPKQPNHTFYFHINNKNVIDANIGGNESRWINHSCSPNCEAVQKRGRVHIYALRDIDKGEELNYDYGLTIAEPYSAALLAEYPCHCGSPACRGTLLHFEDEKQPKLGSAKEKKAKKDKKEKTADAGPTAKSKKKEGKAQTKKTKKAEKAKPEKSKEKSKKTKTEKSSKGGKGSKDKGNKEKSSKAKKSQL